MANGTAPDADETTVKRAWVWAKVIGIIGGALIGLLAPAYTAYHLAAGEARAAAAKVKDSTADLAAKTKVDSQVTKNEAEAGYQTLLKEVEALRAEKAARAKTRRHRAQPPALKPLPTDLKKAEQALSGTTPPQEIPAAASPASQTAGP